MDINQVVVENQKLVYSIAYSFRNYTNKEDLFQVGNIGLINAYENYNPAMGAKFTTYAYPYIWGEMNKYVREDRGIKVSRDITKLNLKIEKASILLSQRLMREPSLRELACYLEIPEEQLTEAIKSVNALQSIDEPIVTDGKEMTLHDTIPMGMMDMDMLLTLKSELESLTPFEKSLIETRYMRDMTQTETAKTLGISQVQVSRKEQLVLQKLRDRLVA